MPRPFGTRRFTGVALCLLGGFASAAATALEVPVAEGRITDLAGLLDGNRRARLEATLEEAESRSAVQLFVLTLPSLEGESLEEFSAAVARSWGIGHEGADDGALLLIVRDDRLLRLEVGYGLEAKLTDLEAGRLLQEAVAPRLRAGDPGGAIEAGVDAVLAHLGSPPQPVPEEKLGPMAGALLALGGGALLLFVTLRVACAPGGGPWFVFAFFLLPCYAFFAVLAPPSARGRVALSVLAVAASIFVLLRVVVRHTAVGRRWGRASRLGRLLGADREPEKSTGSEGFSRESAGGGSRGGFSGSGGDFGGGGASAKW